MNVALERKLIVGKLPFISGDVEMNPGPVRGPCNKCRKTVGKNHITCKNCDEQYCIKCSGITRRHHMEIMSDQHGDHMEIMSDQHGDHMEISKCYWDLSSLSLYDNPSEGNRNKILQKISKVEMYTMI